MSHYNRLKKNSRFREENKNESLMALIIMHIFVKQSFRIFRNLWRWKSAKLKVKKSEGIEFLLTYMVFSLIFSMC